ncbi:Hypothetical protein ADU72_1236 [Pediococcus damnosus]|uniref:Uncharacterized protein n=1 Tax=Pediococcus damnosus TaxID=51663 RepID=A0AAC9B215_9LACO|nr:hypothetical protein [Pediococcus damnosus]AMV60598.1 Hypothetical protein ADU69_0937 [Pediococcus damnosus]AMV62944.1 Hypothetical protein ADU70_1460 [Pediococcus damnosus]AMV64912.1 Hypothetical protein ADU71_1014 [Pediococcus damnosus]AMV67169.1 Hypothetical protein ADU72_1236 [Pediococcus damnosus]AMV69226.1 Hypothetical protein ADU73_0820 [Pediococcus damnosus]
MGFWAILALFIIALACGILAAKQRNKNRTFAVVLTVMMILALAIVLYLT